MTQETRVVAFRLTPELLVRLRELCVSMGEPQSVVLRRLVHGASIEALRQTSPMALRPKRSANDPR